MKNLFSTVFALTIWLILNTPAPVQAQEKIRFQNISLKDGLSQSTINCIIKDRQGFMWFGTLDGLNRYDGYVIRDFNLDTTSTGYRPGAAINCLFSDYEGNIWIGLRSAGLAKYDYLKGKFIYFENPGLLPDRNVTTITMERQRFLWVGTSGGISRIDLRDTSAIHYRFNALNAHTVNSNDIKKLLIDSANTLWIASKEGINTLNIKSYNPKDPAFTSFKASSGLTHDLLTTSVYDLHFTRQGLWLATGNGLAKYDPKTGKTQHYPYTGGSLRGPSSPMLTCLASDLKGNLWIGSTQGLSKFLTDVGVFIHYYSNPVDPTSLSVNHVLSVYADNTGMLWAGTALGGVCKWSEWVKPFYVIKYDPYNKNSLNSNLIRSFCEDHQGKIWVGTVDAGLNCWDRSTGVFTHYSHIEGQPNTLSHNHVRALAEDRYGNLWVGTEGGGLNMLNASRTSFRIFQANDSNRNSLSSNEIWDLFVDSKNQLWIGTIGGGLDRVNLNEAAKTNFTQINFEHFRNDPKDPNSLSDNNVSELFEDSFGQFWVGTRLGGLNRLNPDAKTFKRYTNNAAEGNMDRIYSIIEAHDKVLWIGTKGSLNRYNREKDNFTAYDRSRGFMNNVLMGLLEDNKGRIWISTNKGIALFTPGPDTVRTYLFTDGLQSNEFMVNAYYKTRDGAMLFGGQEGFNLFFPERIKDNPNPPPLVISSFRIFDQEIVTDTVVSCKKEFRLMPGQRSFTFEFDALDYVNPSKNQYEYKMEGFDKHWIKAGDRRFASYTNLPPGTYTFRVRGSNNDGVWNKQGIEVQVVIVPHFYQRFWFRALVVLIIIAIVFFAIRTRDIARDRNTLEAQVRERTREIQKQKEQIMEQNEELKQQQEEILAQRDEIELQRDIANEQKKALTDSITYARRIQQAILTPRDYIGELLPEHFIFYRPRDIVSGDYYWFRKKNGKIIVVAADCTGHGVPGGFLSMLGISFFNEIVSRLSDPKPDAILNELRNMLIRALHQTGKFDEAKDGMDIAMVVIDYEQMTLEYAGAYNPLLINREGQISEIKADRMPVGISDKDKTTFTRHIWNMQPGDQIYLFSDGYVDQFGGPDGEKKFMIKPFKELLVQIGQHPMEEQGKLIEQAHDRWKGEETQVDDIIVVGIKL